MVYQLLLLHLCFRVYKAITLITLGFASQALLRFWFGDGKWKQRVIVSCNQPDVSSANTVRIHRHGFSSGDNRPEEERQRSGVASERSLVASV